MNYSKTFILALIVTSMAVAPAFAKRFGPEDCFEQGGKGKQHFAKISEALELTTQQEEQIQAIIAGQREATADLREKVQANRDAMHGIFDQEALDESRLQELTREQAELHTELMIAKHATRTKIDKLLTPEQQQKHAELRQQRRDHREHRKGPNGWDM